MSGEDNMKIGDTVRGKVCRAAPFGVFVELLPGVEGLCHRSEISEEAGKRRNLKQQPASAEEPALPIGQEFDFKIIKLNEGQKRIGLSLRAVSDEDEKSRLQDYKRQAAAATSTVGDAIKQHQSEEKSEDKKD